MDHVPLISWGKTEVQLRKDARFGLDDFTLWPQWHQSPVSNLLCVLRKWFPSAPEGSKVLACFWWTSSHPDIKLPGAILSSKIRLIQVPEMAAIEELKGKLVKEAEGVLKKLGDDLGVGMILPMLLPGLGASVSFMRHTWLWLTDTVGRWRRNIWSLPTFNALGSRSRACSTTSTGRRGVGTTRLTQCCESPNRSKDALLRTSTLRECFGGWESPCTLSATRLRCCVVGLTLNTRIPPSSSPTTSRARTSSWRATNRFR